MVLLVHVNILCFNTTPRHILYIFPTTHTDSIHYASLRQSPFSVALYSVIRQAESLHCASKEG